MKFQNILVPIYHESKKVSERVIDDSLGSDSYYYVKSYSLILQCVLNIKFKSFFPHTKYLNDKVYVHPILISFWTGDTVIDTH